MKKSNPTKEEDSMKFRGPTDFASNASKLHKRIGALLLAEDSPFRGHTIYQEYPVREVNSAFKSGREKYDWAIPQARLVIEIQGQHHEKPVCYGGEQKHNAKNKFVKQLERDNNKQLAVDDAGWTLVAISYKEKGITLEQLVEKINLAIVTSPCGPEAKAVDLTKPPKKDKPKVKYNWPSRKIPSRPFSRKVK